MMLRLALRSLTIRPMRTAVLAAGFGLGIGVMAALLGVGEVILEQAHAPALNGGGDAVVSGAFGAIENARFVLSNIGGAGPARRSVVAASPRRKATLYLIKPGMSVPVTVRGGVPSLERAVGDPEIANVPSWTDEASDSAWSHPPADEVLRWIDRFHPIPKSDNRSWAEWLYFNGRTPDGRLRFYLTFLAGTSDATGRRPVIVRLQLDRDGKTTNYSAGTSVDASDVIDRAPDLDIAGNRVHVIGSQYQLSLDLRGEGSSRSGVEGTILLDVPAGRSLPPAEIHAAQGWVSGYVVPVLAGPLHGSLRIGNDTISLDGATGYHDHNWGFWAGVRWQWGQVAANDLSFVFGRVLPPPSVADPERVPGFLGVLGPDGPIAFSSDVRITESGDPDRAPSGVTIEARGQRLGVRLALSVEEAVSSRLAMTQLPGAAAMMFLQLGGVYRITGNAGDRTLDVSARGSAETFRANP
jgi:hypothetical protein